MRPRWLPWLMLLVLADCTAPAPPSPSQACAETGLASWYRPEPGQTRMADGKRLDASALTAAHRTLPFGTELRVTDLDTGRSVVVRITDRGPVARDRIIDLSPAAAAALAMRHDGIAHVRLQQYPDTTAVPAGAACLLSGATSS